MTKSDRLEPIAKLAEDKERIAARALGDAQRMVAERKARLAELMRYRDEYYKRFTDGSQSSRPAALIADFRVFIRRLDDAVNQQRRLVDVAAKECERRRLEWLRLRGKAQALDKVIDRAREAEQLADNRKEQKVSDDRAQRPRSISGADEEQ